MNTININSIHMEQCFICMNDITADNKYFFDEFILENMPCTCYKYNSIHSDCFSQSLNTNKLLISTCIFCRSKIEKCIQNSDYELDAIKEDPFKIQLVKIQTPELCLVAVKEDGTCLQYIKEQTDKLCFIAIKQDMSVQLMQKIEPFRLHEIVMSYCRFILFMH